MQLAPFKSLFNVFIFFVSTNVPSLPVQGCLCWAYTGCKILITLYVWMNTYYTCFWIIIHYMVIWPYISHFNLFIFLSLFLPVFWREKSPRNSFLPLLAITAVTIELKECIHSLSSFRIWTDAATSKGLNPSNIFHLLTYPWEKRDCLWKELSETKVCLRRTLQSISSIFNFLLRAV